MKNQYFGDINDYRKYVLLRRLGGMGRLSTTLCWMLTEDDDSGEGQVIRYLDAPDRWRHLDPALFDFLRGCLERHRRGEARRVKMIEESSLLPGCRFFAEILTDDGRSRPAYFDRLASAAAGSDLVFFDPDNGLEVPSRPYGRRGACKHLYFDELARTFAAGHSVVVYQYFPRVAREPYIRDRAAQLVDHAGVPEVHAFQTSTVCFFLLAQPRHARHLSEAATGVAESCGDDFRLSRHGRSP